MLLLKKQLKNKSHMTMYMYGGNMNTNKLLKTAKPFFIILCSVILLSFILLIGAGWYFSDLLFKKAFDPVRPERKNDTKVITCNENSITLEKILFYDDDYRSKGIYGIKWEKGFGLLTDIISFNDNHITRRFHLTSGSMPQPGEETLIDIFIYPYESYQIDELPSEEIFYTSAPGKFSAYYVHNREKTWVILIHGNSMERVDTRRQALSLKNLGYPTLNISYRNDKDQPKDPSGNLQYGITEWRDLEGAVHYAMKNGAKNIVLLGISMGGGIALNFIYKSELRDKIQGLVLDSPILDFGKTVDLNAKKERVPGLGLPVPRILIDMAKFLCRVRFKIEWQSINYLKDADKLDVPVLLFHGTDDRTIPVTTSDEFSEKRKDLIYRYVRIDGVGHVRSWNFDPAMYEKYLSDFLEYCKDL